MQKLKWKHKNGIYDDLELVFISRVEIKKRQERFAEFGNPLQQYRAVQFTDITEVADYIVDFDTDILLKTQDHITIFENGKFVVAFMDGTKMECESE